MTVCRSEDCDNTITPESRSREHPYYCRDCGDLVYAMRPNRHLPDEWFMVCRDGSPVPGTKITANQCDGCGLNEFTIVALGLHDFVAICAGQFYDGEWRPGCGIEHPVRQKMGCEVIW